MLALSRREQVLCASLLVMIICLSATGVWLTWRALNDEQVQLQGQSTAKTGASGEHSIETDLTRRDTFGLAKPAPPASGTASAESASDRSSPALQTSQATTIDGTVVAAVVSVVLLCAAAGAVRLVLARYRRTHEEGAETGGAERCFLDLIGDEPESDAEDVDLPQDASAAPNAEESAEPEGTEQSAEPELVEVSDHLASTSAEPALMGESLLVDGPAVPAQRSSWEARQEAPIGGGSSRPLDSPLVGQPSSFDAAAHAAASENIFDRRAARRVPYVQSAWLWWGDANGPVMVQDLSATGLRLRFPAPGSAPPPTLGQSLRLFFPVSGSTIKAHGRVQWRRTVDGATEVGLQFLDLSAGDQELIQSVLLAAE